MVVFFYLALSLSASEIGYLAMGAQTIAYICIQKWTSISTKQTIYFFVVVIEVCMIDDSF